MAPAVATAAHRSAGSKSHGAKTSAKASTKASSKVKASSKKKAARGGKRVRGQQAMEPSRVIEIQQALIREKYLDGEADGQWDARSIAAMKKFQADQSWQTKIMPDPRALKKLGLGADYSNALNAKEVSPASPSISGTTTPEQATGFATAAGVNR